VIRHFRALGDLGSAAEALAPTATTTRGTLTLLTTYRSLLELARASGTGARQRKGDLLLALLKRATALEAKYLVRIVQGRLRLGVGDQTILEAAAAGALGDRREKPVIEHAYNIRADLGAIVCVAYADGKAGLARITPEIGVPVRPALAQRLGSVGEIVERLGMVQAEPKFDGFRLQLHRDGERVLAFSRRLENVTGMFPEVAAALCRQLKARRAIVEGEAVVYNPESGEFLPFQVTMTRKRKHRVDEMAERYPLRFFAFDLLYVNGRNYIPRPLRARYARLAALLPGGPDDPVATTEMLPTDSPERLQLYFDEMVERGLEGIVAKRPDSPYHAGARQYNWVKLKRAYQSKLRDTVDVVLVGYLVGRGKRAALGIGSLVGAVYDPAHDRFRTVAKIGSGLAESEWKELRAMLDACATAKMPRRVDALLEPDVWVEPRYVVTVLADEITRSPVHTCGKVDGEPGYALRFPRLVSGVRVDKAAEDATTEQEILDMYRAQGAPARRAAKGGKTRAKGAKTTAKRATTRSR
ncbi:MAG TPA: ATP-dependent DNA ligase, partial [Gemmatimonadaceae bacterium]|nr:ATP-dependent DNA ligase [Gemmatimonadaceae bacterium]